jgi:recombinational DNA repair protein (RecF pathway)
MGVKPATDIFQARMMSAFMSMPKDRPKPYIDDIFHGNKGSSFDEHLEILVEIFRLLRLSGMQVNLDKSKLCQKQVKFLGFLLTRTGFIPTRKRVDAILRLPPVKQVRQLLSTINFIKNHIPNRAAIMQPITDLTKKEEKFEWRRSSRRLSTKRRQL